MTEPARTVGAADIDPTVSWGPIRVPQDAIWGVVAGLAIGAVLTFLLPGWAKAAGPLVGMAQVTVSLARYERVGGWKLIGAKLLAGSLPNRIEGGARYRERMRVLDEGTRAIQRRRRVRERDPLAVAWPVEVVADGVVLSPDRGHMAVLRYDPPGEHWASEAHERWARRFVSCLQELGGSAQLWTRIRQMDGRQLRAHQGRAIAEAVAARGTPVPAEMIEAELRHAERLAQDVHVVEHFLALHPMRDGLWTPRWQGPPRAEPEEAERHLESAVLRLGREGLRVRRATAQELRDTVSWAVNGGQIAYAEPGAGAVLTAEGERRMLALSRPPRELFPGALMEAAAGQEATTVVVTTRLAPIPEHEAIRQLRRVERDYVASGMGQRSRADRLATELAIGDVEGVIHQIYLERASSWRWQTLIEVTTAPGASLAVVRALRGELADAGWKPQALSLWPLHSHAAMALGAGALKRFQMLMPGTAAAYALPVMGTPFSDPMAPVLGRNELTGTPVTLDLTREYSGGGTQTNRNLALIGPTGSGKTTTLGVLIAGLASRGAAATVLDYHSEYGALVRAYGGRSVELIDTALNPFAGVVEGMGSAEREWLRQSISILAADHLGDDRRGLRAEEDSWLSEALNWFVNVWLDERRPAPPLLEDFLRRVEPELARAGSYLPRIEPRMATNLLLRLRTWTQGLKGQTFNRHSTLDLSENRLIGLGMRKLRDSLSTESLYGPIAIVLSAFHRELTRHGPNEGARRGRGYAMFLVVDEAHLAFGDPTLGPALLRFSREARKYLGGTVTASQNLDDYLGGRNSRSFLENAGTRMFLGVTALTRDRVQEVAGLEDWELDFLVQRADRGFGVLMAGQERAMVQVSPNEGVRRRLLEASAD
jgi:hypothetical protein